jgi:hypothetical protein
MTFWITLRSRECGHANYIHIASEFTILQCPVNRIQCVPCFYPFKYLIYPLTALSNILSSIPHGRTDNVMDSGKTSLRQ